MITTGIRGAKGFGEIILAFLTAFIIISDNTLINLSIEGLEHLEETETLSAFETVQKDTGYYIVDNLESYKEINKTDGYVTRISPNGNKVHIKYTGPKDRGVAVITNPKYGETSYRIDDNTYIELKDGDGAYTIREYVLIGNSNNNKGTLKSTIRINVTNSEGITNNLGAAYEINASIESNALVKMVDDAWENSTNNTEYIKNCYDKVHGLNYDTEKAENLNQNYFIYKSYIDETIENEAGICLDKAALLADMLRLKGLPTRIVRGYYDGMYHAWNEVFYDNEWHAMDPTIYGGFNVDYSTHWQVSKYT